MEFTAEHLRRAERLAKQLCSLVIIPEPEPKNDPELPPEFGPIWYPPVSKYAIDPPIYDWPNLLYGVPIRVLPHPYPGAIVEAM